MAADHKVEWEDKEYITGCVECNKQFGLLTWKHHCRACGLIFCEDCTNFYTKLPESELCPGHPDYISNQVPQRCCCGCSLRVKLHKGEDDAEYAREAERLRVKSLVGINIIDSLDYNPSVPSKVYKFHIPYDRTVFPDQVIRVVVGGRVNHIAVPPGTHPASVLYVRANDGITEHTYPSTEQHGVTEEDTSKIVDKVIDRLHLQGELPVHTAYYPLQYAHSHGSGSDNESCLHGEVDSVYGDYVTCRACSHHNSGDRRHCDACHAKL